jgi:hypothetical protein
MKRFDCPKAAMERSKLMCAAMHPAVVRHMETAPSSEPVPTHPDPRAWARSVEALGDQDPQVLLATTRAG